MVHNIIAAIILRRIKNGRYVFSTRNQLKNELDIKSIPNILTFCNTQLPNTDHSPITYFYISFALEHLCVCVTKKLIWEY